MLEFIIYIFLCICISYALLSIYSLYTPGEEGIIRQIEYINEQTFDNLLRKKNPVCIHKAKLQLPELFLETLPASLDVQNYVKHLHSTLSFEQMVFNNHEIVNDVICTERDRTFIIQTKGETILRLYPPSQKHFLYLSRRMNHVAQFKIGPIFENLKDENRFPLLNEAKYVNITLREGQIMFVPYGWSFSLAGIRASNTLLSTSHSIATKFLEYVD